MSVREVLGLPPVDEDIQRRFGPPTYTEAQVLQYAALSAQGGGSEPVAWHIRDTWGMTGDRVTTDAKYAQRLRDAHKFDVRPLVFAALPSNTGRRKP